jgi:SAM-dependent methyltransferase
MLNIACGTRMHWGWNNLDFSPYAALARRPGLTRLLAAVGFISHVRLARLAQVDRAIIRHDLRKGIPFPDGTFDVVYHSHFLEHLHPDDAPSMLQECLRVLKPGGVLRVVVPDLQTGIARYHAAVARLEANGDDARAADEHEAAVRQLFDQMVRRETTGTSEQRRWVRRVERLVRGDPSKTGESHQWMYDKHSLATLLGRIGFAEPRVQSAVTSRVEGWVSFELDTSTDGVVYKPESLFMEAIKPV